MRDGGDFVLDRVRLGAVVPVRATPALCFAKNGAPEILVVEGRSRPEKGRPLACPCDLGVSRLSILIGLREGAAA